MKKLIYLFATGMILSCDQPVEKTRGVLPEEKVKLEAPVTKENLEAQRELLEKRGYNVFTYEEEDTAYLMQQYYVVFLKEGENRDQDTIEAEQLQEEHLAFLSRMYEEGYSSLTGPMGDNGEIRGMVVFKTPTLEEADSLARLDPMVKAGRLDVEVRPWWVPKGGRLE